MSGASDGLDLKPFTADVRRRMDTIASQMQAEAARIASEVQDLNARGAASADALRSHSHELVAATAPSAPIPQLLQATGASWRAEESAWRSEAEEVHSTIDEAERALGLESREGAQRLARGQSLLDSGGVTRMLIVGNEAEITNALRRIRAAEEQSMQELGILRRILGGVS